MRKLDDQLVFSPSDLITFMGSEFASRMDRLYLESRRDLSPDDPDESARIISQLGDQHEKEILKSLKDAGRDVFEVPSQQRFDEEYETTLAAMRRRHEVIFQGALCAAPFAGYTDFLVRVDGAASSHYEVWDAKLARRAKPYFIIQLCSYAEMLEVIQGVRPVNVLVALGSGDRTPFTTNEFFYYYRYLRRSFLELQESIDANSPIQPTGFEDYGRWTTHAESLLEEADHLCRVANISSVQAARLQKVGIHTLTGLAGSELQHVPKMDPAILNRLKQQARLQLASRGRERPAYEVQPADVETPRRGLALLPPESRMDVFFDMEGYPLIDGGLEYLFGAVHLDDGQPRFVDWWAHDSHEEKQAFEQFIDWVYDRWRKDPAMHIYHYAHYEVAALRRLMGAYGTRENELDQLLRNEVFVDLYRIVVQGLRIGTSSYSIKDVEKLYRPPRTGEVSTAVDSIVAYQKWIESQEAPDWRNSPALSSIRDYNADDCTSTWELTVWLRALQTKHEIVWVSPATAGAGDDIRNVPQSDAQVLAEKLLDDIPDDRGAEVERWRVQELLAHLLEFHRREAKPGWWAMFDRQLRTDEELYDDLDCLSQLRRTNKPLFTVKRSCVYEYAFNPDQETKLSAGKTYQLASDINFSVTLHDLDTRTGLASVKVGKQRGEPPHAISLIPGGPVSADSIAASIYRTVNQWADGGELQPCLSDFLHRRNPRIKGRVSGQPIADDDITVLQDTIQAAQDLDESVLCIQGPPGAGKTYTAAHAIVELIRSGNKVAVTSNSHKAISNLMRATNEVAGQLGTPVHAVKVGGDADEELFATGAVRYCKDLKDVDLSRSGVPDLFGATAWPLSREELVGLFDYLFIDEAGQVSIANLVGMAPCTDNIVIIGDQMQLAQPIQGAHPSESGMSVMDYFLGDRKTVPPESGIFLGTSYRMHPDVCQFISEAVYEGRLHSAPAAAKRIVRLHPDDNCIIRQESGIVFVPVPHEGNSQGSEEEVNAIVQIVEGLLGRELTDDQGEVSRRLALEDILFVAPYNLQVRQLQRALGERARVGSVDKFQGQEATVVILSMCASTADASPRGMEFLLNRNRLNVAISRAQSLAIVVGSPALCRARCSSIEQMRLVNLFCRLVDYAGSGLHTRHRELPY